MIGVYAIIRKSDGRMYVGQSRNIKIRIQHHFRGGEKSYISNAIKKHGRDAFKVEILEYCDERILNDRERFWIAALDTMKPKGYNLTDGGEGYHHSEETKRRIGQIHRGKKLSLEQRKHLSKVCSGKGNPFYGKRHSEETKQKLRQANVGKKMPEDHKRKLREINLGRKHSEETKKKISDAHRGKPKPASVREKLSQRRGEKHHHFGKKQSPEFIEKRRQALSHPVRKQWYAVCQYYEKTRNYVHTARHFKCSRQTIRRIIKERWQIYRDKQQE